MRAYREHAPSKDGSTGRVHEHARSRSGNPGAYPVELALQRSIGNRATTALLAAPAIQRLRKPNVVAPTGAHGKRSPVRKLYNIVQALYKGSKPQIGDGSAADALRREAQTGKPVGGRFHHQKVSEIITALFAIRDHAHTSDAMFETIEALLDDCEDAVEKWQASPYAKAGEQEEAEEEVVEAEVVNSDVEAEEVEVETEEEAPKKPLNFKSALLGGKK